MIENIRLSFQGIWAHKMRSFLTMLGIIIGIASLISIVSTIKGTNEQIKKNLIGEGDNVVDVYLGQGGSEYEMEYQGVPEGVPVITKEQKEKIADLDEVTNVTCYQARKYADSVFYQNKTMNGGAVFGIDTDYLDTCGYQIIRGRGFSKSDYGKFQKVVLIDETASSNFFEKGEEIGKVIEIKGEPFTVVGVIKKTEEFEPVINSREEYYTYYNESSGMVLVPDSTWPIIYRYDEPQLVSVKATSPESMSAAGKKTAEILNESIVSATGDIKYKARDMMEKAKDLQQISESTQSPAFVDCQYFSPCRRHRRYEYYAGVCDRKNRGNWSEKGDRGKQEKNFGAVSYRGSRAYQYRWNFRCFCRRYFIGCNCQNVRCTDGNQCTGGCIGSCFFNGNWFDFWFIAICESGKSQSD